MVTEGAVAAGRLTHPPDPARARVVARYIVANLVKLPEGVIRNEHPEIHGMTQALADEAGCPFDLAFLMFLPVLSMPSAPARLWINGFFLVPPIALAGRCS